MKFLEQKLIKVDFFLNDDYVEENKSITYAPEIVIKSELIEEEKTLAVLLGVRITEKRLPFCFEVHCSGMFKFDKLPDIKLIEQFGEINCPAILFPYVRETIADLTRRAGYSPVHLDPINFVELAKQRVERKKTKAIKKSPVKKKVAKKKTAKKKK